MDLTWQNFWYEFKFWVESALGMSKDLMHVHFGLGVFLTFAVLLRERRNGVLISWFIVASLQTLNEMLDARDWIHWTGTVHWTETFKDYVTTLFWPTMLLLGWACLGSAKKDG